MNFKMFDPNTLSKFSISEQAMGRGAFGLEFVTATLAGYAANSLCRKYTEIDSSDMAIHSLQANIIMTVMEVAAIVFAGSSTLDLETMIGIRVFSIFMSTMVTGIFLEDKSRKAFFTSALVGSLAVVVLRASIVHYEINDHYLLFGPAIKV
jgi:putative N-acetylmannosamine-6-phosphate epimerase